MKKQVSKKLIVSLAVLAALVLFGSYRFISLRHNAESKIAGIEVSVERDRGEIVDLYRQRAELLESWEKAVAKGEIPKALRLSDTVRNAKNLKLDSDADAAHFDFVQNQVSQAIGEYLQSDIGKKTKPKNLEKLEESINFRRRDYHRSAFEIASLQTKYHLNSPRPLIFPAERMLKDHGLFK
jgi:hypothetical protein